jgi:hypothetical protein
VSDGRTDCSRAAIRIDLACISDKWSLAANIRGGRLFY